MKKEVPLEDNFKIIKEILSSGELSGFRARPEFHLGGKWVQKLEAEFCEYFGVRYAISMNSATACLHSALIACGVGEGDEVIVTPYSFSSSASCVLMTGARPVFVDIEDDTFNLDPGKIVRAITPRTRAIIPVHLMGHPAEMDGLVTVAFLNGFALIEDASQAIGATYFDQYAGTFGDCGIFSFNQSKHINTGEGGILITDDDDIARIARAVRNHGEISDPELETLGYNYRMNEIEAAIALPQLAQLNEMTAHRIKLANYMTERLSEIGGFIPPITREGCKHVFYTYGVKFKGDRDKFQDEMIKRGIYFGKDYVKPLYLLPIYGYEEGLCPVAEKVWKEIMVFDWLKYPTTFEDIDKAIGVVRECLNYGCQ